MNNAPLTPGNIVARPITSIVAWCAVILVAPLLLLQSAQFLPIALGEARNVDGVEHTFTLDMKQATDRPKTVHVAGEFNGWNPQGLAMTDDGTGMWTAKLRLEEGQYQYKFVLDAGTPKQKWIQDPAADPELKIDDGNQGFNSVMIIGPAAVKFPPAQPNNINAEAVIFNPTDASDLDAIDDKTFRVRVRTLGNDVEQAWINIDTAAGVKSIQLAKVGTARGLDAFGGVVTSDIEKPTAWFTFFDGGAKLILESKGKVAIGPNESVAMKPIGFSFDVKPAIETPTWARHAVWYQIFPERFRNGDPNNDPGDKFYENLVPWTSDWWATLPGEKPGAENFYHGVGNVWDRRYGGDIAGVREKLPYLRSLGVNAIYFNPVFEAESMHKYDTADFRHIDDNLGVRDEPLRPQIGSGSDKPVQAYKPIGNRKLFNLDGSPVSPDHVETDDPSTWRWTKSDLLFLDFLKEARSQGFYVVIDGVFNHVGRAHPFFQDVLKNGKNSRYTEWFEITDWGDPKNWREMVDPWEVHGKPGGIQFKAWDRVNGHLPVFKKDAARGLAEGPYNHIMGITRRWLDPDGNPQTRDGIDGWRLDVPGDIPHPFWKDWRKVVKAANPQGYIVGEIWPWANAWINAGDEFDATMNYQFAMPCQEFFANVKSALKPSQFNDRLVKLVYNYPFQAALVMQNLFDSHDTDRSPSWFVNPDRPYDAQNRPHDNAKEIGYDTRRPNETERKRWLQMVAFQMTFVGAPMIYYGNEMGMYGPDDPSDRMPAWWKDLEPFDNSDFYFDDKTFAFHQRAIAIRHKFPALQTGFYRPLVVDDANGVLAFARDKGDETVIVVINRSDKSVSVEVPVKDGSQLINYMSDSAIVSFDDNKTDARPTIKAKDGATRLVAENGKLKVELGAYETAILAN